MKPPSNVLALALALTLPASWTAAKATPPPADSAEKPDASKKEKKGKKSKKGDDSEKKAAAG